MKVLKLLCLLQHIIFISFGTLQTMWEDEVIEQYVKKEEIKKIFDFVTKNKSSIAILEY